MNRSHFRGFGKSPLAALAAFWRAATARLRRARGELRDEDWAPPDLAVLEFPTGARAFIPLPGNEELIERLMQEGRGSDED